MPRPRSLAARDMADRGEKATAMTFGLRRHPHEFPGTEAAVSAKKLLFGMNDPAWNPAAPAPDPEPAPAPSADKPADAPAPEAPKPEPGSDE